MNPTSSASKTKRRATSVAVCLTVFLVLFGAFTAFGQTATPEQTARSFYKWYVHELNANRNPPDERAKFGQFVSARLAKWVRKTIASGEYDADYFVAAQDFGHDWGDNVRVSRVAVSGGSATLHVKLVQPKTKDTPAWDRDLDLKLLKEGGAWKIDRVTAKN